MELSLGHPIFHNVYDLPALPQVVDITNPSHSAYNPRASRAMTADHLKVLKEDAFGITVLPLQSLFVVDHVGIQIVSHAGKEDGSTYGGTNSRSLEVLIYEKGDQRNF